MPADLPPEGLSESRFGLRYYIPEIRTLIEVAELRRKNGELAGEMTVRCNLEGVRVQLDGNKMRQGNFNFSSLTTRASWAKALKMMTPGELNDRMEWENILERVSQAVLEHERTGAIHGHVISGQRIGTSGRPWAAWPVLPHGEMATLFAPGGAGKTTLVATTVFGMAIGRSLIPGIRVDRPYRTVILDWETNPETADDLWGLISESYRVPVPQGVWYEPMELPIERALPKIAAIIERHRADCIVVDSVMMALLSSGDYSDPAESITRVYQALRRIGTWGLLIDHVTGSDVRAQRLATKAYGSVFKTFLARHALTLQIGERDGDTSQAYLACPKSNVGRDRWAMSGTVVRTDDEIQWSFGEPSYELYERLISGAEEGVMPEPIASPRRADKIILSLADAERQGKTPGALASELLMSQASIRVGLNRLARDGLVERDTSTVTGVERPWRLTETGWGFLHSLRGPVDEEAE